MVKSVKPDFETRDHGSMIEFLPLTARGRAWVKKNTGGETVAEHRYGIDILQGILAAGLVLRDALSGRLAGVKP
jgi:hypothetical protein